jgi:hypothetical protein
MSATEITARRELAGGTVKWTVNEFNGGTRFMLVATATDTQYNAHFDAE